MIPPGPGAPEAGSPPGGAPARVRLRGRSRIAPPRVPEAAPAPPRPWFRRALVGGCLVGLVGLGIQHRAGLATLAPDLADRIGTLSPGVGTWIRELPERLERRWANLDAGELWGGVRAKVGSWWDRGLRTVRGPGPGAEGLFPPDDPVVATPSATLVPPDPSPPPPASSAPGATPSVSEAPSPADVVRSWLPDFLRPSPDPHEEGEIPTPEVGTPPPTPPPTVRRESPPGPRPAPLRGPWTGFPQVVGAEGLVLEVPDGTRVDLHPHSRFRYTPEGLALLSGGALVRFAPEGSRIFLPGKRRVEGEEGAMLELVSVEEGGSVDVLGPGAVVVGEGQRIQLAELHRLELAGSRVVPVPEAEASLLLRRLAWFGSHPQRRRAPLLAVELALATLRSVDGTPREAAARRALAAAREWANRVATRRRDEAFAQL